MTQLHRLTLQASAFPLSLRTRGLPLRRSPLPSPLDQERSSSCMGQVALGRHTCTTPSATTFAHRGRLCSVWHPLGLLHFFSMVVGLLTPGLRSPSHLMSLQCA